MMNHRHAMPYRLAMLLCLLSLCLGSIDDGQAATTSYDDVYKVTDLSNRGLDVILRKTKGVKQPALPQWTEKGLNRFHVYQLQVACLDEIRRMEAKFKMTPYPHIIVSPGQLSEKHLYKLSAIILSEIRRIAIHLNIWGLPKQKRGFSGESPNDICEETVALYLKLRVLGGRKMISTNGVAAELGRAIADVKILLNSIDAARRYQDVFPPPTQQNTSQSYSACLAVRKELNAIRTFYKLPAVALPKPQKTPSLNELFIQSQIILGEINQIKTRAGAAQPAPPMPSKTTRSTGSQLNTLHKLIGQIKPLAKMNQQGGK